MDGIELLDCFSGVHCRKRDANKRQLVSRWPCQSHSGKSWLIELPRQIVDLWDYSGTPYIDECI